MLHGIHAPESLFKLKVSLFPKVEHGLRFDFQIPGTITHSFDRVGLVLHSADINNATPALLSPHNNPSHSTYPSRVWLFLTSPILNSQPWGQLQGSLTFREGDRLPPTWFGVFSARSRVVVPRAHFSNAARRRRTRGAQESERGLHGWLSRPGGLGRVWTSSLRLEVEDRRSGFVLCL